jgi:hypothetical protein
MSDDAPKVFGVGDVTVCLNNGSLRLYVGHLEVTYVRKLEMKYEGDKIYLDISFFVSHDPDVSKLIEESVRTAKTIPWIHISP